MWDVTMHTCALQAELIQLMDKEGIGTDATMATHIATIQQRGYATCDSRFEKSHYTSLIIIMER